MQRTVTTTITEDYCDLCDGRTFKPHMCVVCKGDFCGACCGLLICLGGEICKTCVKQSANFMRSLDEIDSRRDKDREAVIEKWREAVKE